MDVVFVTARGNVVLRLVEIRVQEIGRRDSRIVVIVVCWDVTWVGNGDGSSPMDVNFAGCHQVAVIKIVISTPMDSTSLPYQ